MHIKKIFFNQEVNEEHFFLSCQIIFEKYLIKAMEDFFWCLHTDV